MIILAYQANGLSYILKKYRIIRIRIHIHRIFKNPYHILVSDIFGVDWISVFTLVKTISVFAEKATEEENRMAGEDFPPALIFIALSLSREREKKKKKRRRRRFPRRVALTRLALRPARGTSGPHTPPALLVWVRFLVAFAICRLPAGVALGPTFPPLFLFFFPLTIYISPPAKLK